MSVLRVIVGNLDECEEKINELEESGYEVNVVHARPLLETPHLLGSGTGHQVPHVKMWQMLLQYKHKQR